MKNILNQVKIQLQGYQKNYRTLDFQTKNFFEYKVNDFKLINYEHHPKIEANMNVFNKLLIKFFI